MSKHYIAYPLIAIIALVIGYKVGSVSPAPVTTQQATAPQQGPINSASSIVIPDAQVSGVVKSVEGETLTINLIGNDGKPSSTTATIKVFTDTKINYVDLSNPSTSKTIPLRNIKTGTNVQATGKNDATGTFFATNILISTGTLKQ